MDPISSQPPYTQWDIDLYALQKQPRHDIQVTIDVYHLPKPFDLKTDKSQKTEKDLKNKPGFQKRGKDKGKQRNKW